jgi:ribosome recycling factor
MARTVLLHTTGGPENLKLENVATRAPEQDEVKLRVEAVGLNRAELMYMGGHYFEQPSLPSRIGYEAAGVVEAVGPGVDASLVGKRFGTVPGYSMNRNGVLGEEAIVPARMLAAFPEKLSSAEGAAIWMQYLTAYGALVMHGKVGKGDFVLITAASSSVGLAAIQIVKAEGGIAIATTRHGNKRDALLAEGADHVIATAEEDLVARAFIRKLRRRFRSSSPCRLTNIWLQTSRSVKSLSRCRKAGNQPPSSRTCCAAVTIGAVSFSIPHTGRTRMPPSTLATTPALKDTHQQIKTRLEKAVVDFQHNLQSIRTGRASVQMLDNVRVDYYGTPSPLNAVAQLLAPDANTLVVQPFDTKMISEIEKALRISEYGFNPQNDGKIVRIPVPPMTEERRRDVVKQLSKVLEEHKTGARNTRREANEQIKAASKDKKISADEEKRALDEVQKMTDEEIKRLDELSKKKEAEIMHI